MIWLTEESIWFVEPAYFLIKLLFFTMAVMPGYLQWCMVNSIEQDLLPFNRLCIIEQRTVSYMDEQPIVNRLCKVYSTA